MRRHSGARQHYQAHKTQDNRQFRRQSCRLKRKRHGRSQRKTRTGGADWRGQISERVTACICQRSINALFLVLDKGNVSVVVTLIERISGYEMLINMKATMAMAAVKGFSAALKHIPLSLRKTMASDQGKEMASYAEISYNTKCWYLSL